MSEVVILGSEEYMRPDIHKLAKALWKDDLSQKLDCLASEARGMGMNQTEQTEYIWRAIYLAVQEAKLAGWRKL